MYETEIQTSGGCKADQWELYQTQTYPILLKVKVSQSCPTLCNRIDCVACQAPLSMEFSRPEHQSGQLFPSPGDLSNPGMEPRFPTLQADSLPSEPPGKPKTTGVGSLSLLQGIFSTQEQNWGLLHCRRIYELSYQGSPQILYSFLNHAFLNCLPCFRLCQEYEQAE